MLKELRLSIQTTKSPCARPYSALKPSHINQPNSSVSQNIQQSPSTTLNPYSLNQIHKQNTQAYFNSISPPNPNTTINTTSVNEHDNLTQLAHMINAIKHEGFEKYQQEYTDKLKLKAKLQESVNTFQRKIHIYKNIKPFGSSLSTANPTKEEQAILNLNSVSLRYKTIGDNISKYQKEIPLLKLQIEKLKRETIRINELIIEEKHAIDSIKDTIQKLNKQISDKAKEKDNFRPAMTLLTKHTQSLKLKIKNIEIQKSDFMLNITEFTKKKVKNK